MSLILNSIPHTRDELEDYTCQVLKDYIKLLDSKGAKSSPEYTSYASTSAKINLISRIVRAEAKVLGTGLTSESCTGTPIPVF